MVSTPSRPVEQNPSWLAMPSGCCAFNKNEDDGKAELQANGEKEMKICYDQPQIIPAPRIEAVRPRSSHTTHSIPRHVSQWVASGQDFARSSISTLSRPRKSHARSRPSIGFPTDFKHYDGVDGIQSMVDEAPLPVRRRRSFSPLELSIYISPSGRLSPLPDFEADDWLQKPPQAVVRDRESVVSTESFQIERKPVGSASKRSSVQSQASCHSRSTSLTLTALPYLQEEPASRTESPLGTPSGLQRASTQSSVSSASRLLSRLPSPSRSRSNTAPSRPTSVRRMKMDAQGVDEAIRELNTIVEERRADAYRSKTSSPALTNRPPPSPSHHVPAIAPSLRMRVRSETLSDIGSAFSAPLNAKPLPATPKPSPLSRTTTNLSIPATIHLGPGPLNSNPITPPTPTVPASPMHRLGAWIKKSIPSPTTSFKTAPSTPKSTVSTPFYQCEPNPPFVSRPSTAGSRTITHTRQHSDETATVTLFSSSNSTHRGDNDNDSMPSTPGLSTRSPSPTESRASPPTPAAKFKLASAPEGGKRVFKHVPAPLVLKKEYDVEPSLASARSSRSARSERSLKPPPSPNYGILKGMEMVVGPPKDERLSAVSAVGIAF